MLDDDYYIQKYHQELRDMQNNNLANQRINAIIASQKEISANIYGLKQENSKLVEENKRLVEELKKQNEVINSLKQPKWQFWLNTSIAFVAAIAAIVACII